MSGSTTMQGRPNPPALGPSASGRRASTLIRALDQELSSSTLVADPEVLETYRRDQAGFVEAGRPAAAVLARTVEDVGATMRVAAAHQAPVVPRGAGSGLSGGANAIDGCIVLSLHRMEQILEIDDVDLCAIVEPGVLYETLSTAVAERGLFYAPDPASAGFSTLGGNIATNAGGLCCLKDGVTRDAVLGLEVVLADGTVLQTGGRTVKRVAGYDLTGLMVGSEGTLGIVTRATVRLRPAPAPPSTMVAFFPTLVAAGRAVALSTSSGVVPSLLEVMDRTTIMAVDEYTGMGLDRDAGALLLAQSDAADPHAEREMSTLADHCGVAGATYVAQTSDRAEGEQFLSVRKLAYPALERRGATLLDDIGVPRSNVPSLLQGIEVIAARRGVEIATFGHIGDGNLHPTIVYDAPDEASTGAARTAFEEILGLALDMGGTTTGEHGVGSLKRPFLGRELGSVGVRVHRRVKDALDPSGLLNPGKALV